MATVTEQAPVVLARTRLRRRQVETAPPRRVRPRKGVIAKGRFGLFYVSAVILGVYAIFPVLWVIDTSLKPASEVTAEPAVLIPSRLSIASYQSAFSTAPFGRFYENSLIVCLTATAFTLVLGSLAGYAVARLRFRGKSFVLLAILAFSFFPPILGVIPLYHIYRFLGLIDTYWALIIPYTFTTLPICVWLMNAYLQDLPRELEEAAMVDGLSRTQAFLRVVLRLSAPGLVTAGLIVFATNWNEFLYALTFMTNENMRTLPVGIALYPGEYSFPWGEISAATVLALVPMAIGVSVFQRRLVSGLTLGAVK